ncbi:tetratricopeptide repeat protein [Microcoleus sp. FACHB-68]|uniref:tetratricopeptide repeat protein n=1 Tax=Microcoleus sp. FACHB-68 TaxID=2692826 RepID=UPI001685DA59|nr:tetratricopeptide repeat protein [Microcoleus sp. FACHB-68]
MNFKSAQLHFNTGKQLKESGKFDEAIGHYQKALEIEPDEVEVLNHLAEVYYALNRLAEAFAVCQKALKIQPNFAQAYKTLGNVLQAQGKLEPAMRAYSKAIDIKPDFAEALANLGSMFYKQGRLEEALPYYQKAVTINPDIAGVYWNLGNLLKQLGQLNEGNACLQRALQLKPELGGAEFLVNLGNALVKQDKWQEAIGRYQSALRLKPDWAEAHCQLGLALWRLNQRQDQFNLQNFSEAVGCLLRAIATKPDLMAAQQGLGNALIASGTDPNELSYLRKAADKYLEISGEKGKIIAKMAFAVTYFKSGLHQLAKEKFKEVETQIIQSSETLNQDNRAILYSGMLLAAPHLRDDLEANTNLFKLVGEQYRTSNNLRVNPYQLGNINESLPFKTREGKLKIGLLSKDFTKQSVAGGSIDVIRELAKLSPHIHLYATDWTKSDETSRKFEQVAAKFYQFKKPSEEFSLYDQEIVKQILEDELDILVDLDSITGSGHAEILDCQPARVCISGLGCEAPFISDKNYFLCDWQTHPAGTEQHYTEQLIRMPNSFLAVSGFDSTPIDRNAVRKSLRIGLDQVVYLCVSPASKLSDEMIEAQIKILKQVPNGVLLYKGLADEQVTVPAYQQACKAQGVGFHRVKFLPPTQTEKEHRSIYKSADVLLDSYPYNGGIQTLEALWFNVPVVTTTGEQGVARKGYSFLKSLNIEAGVSYSWEEYIEWGIRFCLDADLRNEIREHLERAKQPEGLAPVWNPKKFAEDMYSVFEELLAKQSG